MNFELCVLAIRIKWFITKLTNILKNCLTLIHLFSINFKNRTLFTFWCCFKVIPFCHIILIISWSKFLSFCSHVPPFIFECNFIKSKSKSYLFSSTFSIEIVKLVIVWIIIMNLRDIWYSENIVYNRFIRI